MLIPGWPILLPLVMFSTNVLLIHIITLYVLILNRHRDKEKMETVCLLARKTFFCEIFSIEIHLTFLWNILQ